MLRGRLVTSRARGQGSKGRVLIVDSSDEESEEEKPSTRFIAKLLKHLLSGMEAKDKNVRFRVTLMTVSMINGLGEIE